MDFLSALILGIVLLAVVGVILREIRLRKQGKSSCSCGGSCGGCPMSGSCHNKDKKH